MCSSRTGVEWTEAGGAFWRSARVKKEVIEGWKGFLWRCDMSLAIATIVYGTGPGHGVENKACEQKALSQIATRRDARLNN